jgi:hypothetical protein
MKVAFEGPALRHFEQLLIIDNTVVAAWFRILTGISCIPKCCGGMGETGYQHAAHGGLSTLDE